MSDQGCPFCGRDPFHYVHNGVGMEAVAVTCCDLGDQFYRGARTAPEEVTLSWKEFQNVGARLVASQQNAAEAWAAADSLRERLDNEQGQAAIAAKVRADTIEECAKVAEGYPCSGPATEHPVEYWIRQLSWSNEVGHE